MTSASELDAIFGKDPFGFEMLAQDNEERATRAVTELAPRNPKGTMKLLKEQECLSGFVAVSRAGLDRLRVMSPNGDIYSLAMLEQDPAKQQQMLREIESMLSTLAFAETALGASNDELAFRDATMGNKTSAIRANGSGGRTAALPSGGSADVYSTSDSLRERNGASTRKDRTPANRPRDGSPNYLRD
jgi:hypothetical protein